MWIRRKAVRAKIGAQSYPRMARKISNRGLDIGDLDIDSAHFNIAAQEVAKLPIDLEGSYWEIDNVRNYHKDTQDSREVLAADYKDPIRRHHQFFNMICSSAFQ